MVSIKISAWQVFKHVRGGSFSRQRATAVRRGWNISQELRKNMWDHIRVYLDHMCRQQRSPSSFYFNCPLPAKVALERVLRNHTVYGMHRSSKCSWSSQWRGSFADRWWRFKWQQSYFTSDHFSKSIQLMCLSSMVGYSIHLKGHSRGIRLQVLNWGWFHHLSSRLDFLD